MLQARHPRNAPIITMHIEQNLCMATKTCSSSRNLFSSSKTNRKVHKHTWRCLKNNESISPGLMYDHTWHMSHVHTGHCNSARASVNGCISLSMHQKVYTRKVLFSNIQCLSVVTSKINVWHILAKLEIPSYLRILTFPRPNRKE